MAIVSDLDLTAESLGRCGVGEVFCCAAEAAQQMGIVGVEPRQASRRIRDDANGVIFYAKAPGLPAESAPPH